MTGGPWGGTRAAETSERPSPRPSSRLAGRGSPCEPGELRAISCARAGSAVRSATAPAPCLGVLNTRDTVACEVASSTPGAGLTLRPGRLDDELEALPAPQRDGSEVAHVARGDAMNAELLGQRDDRRIDEPQAEVDVLAIDLHGAGECSEGRRGIRERAAREISHERGHRRPLVPEEVIHLGEHQPRDVACARGIDGLAKGGVVWRLRDEIIDERAGVAEERGRAQRRGPPNSSASSPRSGSSRSMIPADLGRGCLRYCSRTSESCWRTNSARDTPRSCAARVRSASISGSSAMVVGFFLASAMEAMLLGAALAAT